MGAGNTSTIDFTMNEKLSRVLHDTALTPEMILDSNSRFILIKCANGDDRKLVLKYSHSDSKDAGRRIRNEAILTRSYPSHGPLRFLDYYCHGDDYLVTGYTPSPLLVDFSMEDEHLTKLTVDSLIEFQANAPDLALLGVRDREPLWYFYLKETLKHLIHLWPDHINAMDGLRAIWHIIKGLPGICSTTTVCHADFLPTNLLYDAHDETIIVTDLEGFMSRNHPLFDVLAFFSFGEQELPRWDWQPKFLQRYLARTDGRLRLKPGSHGFARTYRAMLVFFMLYRYNEARILEQESNYFDGLGRVSYLRKKLKRLLTGRKKLSPAGPTRLMAVRRENLDEALSYPRFTSHLDRMLKAGDLLQDPGFGKSARSDRLS